MREGANIKRWAKVSKAGVSAGNGVADGGRQVGEGEGDAMANGVQGL